MFYLSQILIDPDFVQPVTAMEHRLWDTCFGHPPLPLPSLISCYSLCPRTLVPHGVVCGKVAIRDSVRFTRAMSGQKRMCVALDMDNMIITSEKNEEKNEEQIWFSGLLGLTVGLTVGWTIASNPATLSANDIVFGIACTFAGISGLVFLYFKTKSWRDECAKGRYGQLNDKDQEEPMLEQIWEQALKAEEFRLSLERRFATVVENILRKSAKTVQTEFRSKFIEDQGFESTWIWLDDGFRELGPKTLRRLYKKKRKNGCPKNTPRNRQKKLKPASTAKNYLVYQFYRLPQCSFSHLVFFFL